MLPFPALSSGVMRTLLLGAVLMSHVKHGAGALSGVHCCRALACWGLLDYRVRLFLVHNWPQGRGDPAEGPCGQQGGSLEGGSHLPQEEGQHGAHSHGPGSGIPFCAEESLGRVWSCAAQCGRWLPTGAGQGRGPGSGPLPLASHSGLPSCSSFVPGPVPDVVGTAWGYETGHRPYPLCNQGRRGRSHPAWGHPGGRDGAVESEKGGVSLTRRDPTGRKGTQGSAGTPRSLIFVIKAVGTVEIFEQGRFRVRAVTKRSPWFLCVGRIRGKREAEGVEILGPWQGYDGRGLVWRWTELYWPLDQPVGSWDAHLTLMALLWGAGHGWGGNPLGSRSRVTLDQSLARCCRPYGQGLAWPGAPSCPVPSWLCRLPAAGSGSSHGWAASPPLLLADGTCHYPPSTSFVP